MCVCVCGCVCIHVYVCVYEYVSVRGIPYSNDANPSGTAGHAPSYGDCVGIDTYIEIG
jgi:hypothetical protein